MSFWLSGGLARSCARQHAVKLENRGNISGRKLDQIEATVHGIASLYNGFWLIGSVHDRFCRDIAASALRHKHYLHVMISGSTSKNFPKQIHPRSAQAAIAGSILSLPCITPWEAEAEGAIRFCRLLLPVAVAIFLQGTLTRFFRSVRV